MKTLRMFSLAILTLYFSALTTLAGGDPTGTWNLKVETPNARSIDSTLSLKWENNQLTGTIDNKSGTAEIRNAQFSHDEVTFSVDRKIRRRKTTFNYTGKLEGDTIKGTLQTKGRNNQPITLPWGAERSP